MKLYLIGHSERYAVEQLQMSLFPEQTSEFCEAPFGEAEGAVSALHRGKVWLTATTKIRLGTKTGYGCKRLKAAEETVRMRRRILQQSYYLAALQLLEEAPPWGGMSGVRPSKLTTLHMLAGGSAVSAEKELEDTYFVSPARAKLCIEASTAAVRAVAQTEPRDISLYVGIPFCPTRCSYCSFVSNSIEKCGGMIAPFLDSLLQEAAFTGCLLRESPFRVRTLYIGGGTPTTLSAGQLQQLTDALAEYFPRENLLEYTVECGRPDTITPEKLKVLKAAGVSRISINPQTMNDDVLEGIGRKHTSGDILRSLDEAKTAGFDDINMDLIAGLPGESPERFGASLEQVLACGTSNITVHTLALKKGAALFGRREGLPTTEDVSRMLAIADKALRGAGYRPYYLYRQKYMSGNFENIGWCKPGYEGLYNIFMMEELHSILALGGGGMNKVNLPGGKIERFHNPKYPKEYLDQLDNTLRTKTQIFSMLQEAYGL